MATIEKEAQNLAENVIKEEQKQRDKPRKSDRKKKSQDEYRQVSKKAEGAPEADFHDDAIIASKSEVGFGPEKPAEIRERELTKTKWINDKGNSLETLEDVGKRSNRKFDQFEGKYRSTYRDELYTTSLNMNTISEKQKRQALKIEKEILAQASTNVH